MSRRKTERLLNLVLCLLATRRHLTAERIRRAVPGYPDSDDAFKRMFERDKEELRDLGIPIEIGTDAFDDEPGYRISRSSYELPDIHLDPEEAAVLGLAARVWQRASLADAASGALLKLRAAGIETDEATPPGIEPRIDTDEPGFPVLWEAVRDRRPVTFAYRSAGGGEPRRRHLQPWGMASRHGHWYVAGHDSDRDAVRVFRLSRIIGPVRFAGPPGSVAVPPGVDVRQLVFTSYPPPAARTAEVRIRQGAGFGVRRFARAIHPADTPGWDVAEVTFHDPERLAGWLAGFADDVIVVDPPDAREAMISHLKAALSSASEALA